METCPKCEAEEVPANQPRTVYACGSSDYDQRPGTFVEKCTNSLQHGKKENITKYRQ